MTEQVPFSEQKKQSVPLWLNLVLVVLILTTCFVGYNVYSFDKQSVPEKFPEMPSQNLELNEYYSGILSKFFNYDVTLSDVMSIKVVSSDTFFGRTYIFEYEMNDGSKFIALKPMLDFYENLPAQYEIHRIKKDYLSVLIKTDGSEYKISPNEKNASDIYWEVKYAFDRVKNKDMIAKRWKDANDLVKEKRANYTEALEQQAKVLQAQKDMLEKMREEMDKQIEAAKSSQKTDDMKDLDVAEKPAVAPAEVQNLLNH